MAERRAELQLALDLINEKKYDKARALLLKIPADPTAQKWLDKLDQLAPLENKPEFAAIAAHMSGAGNGSGAAGGPWQYCALEVKRSYGIQYKVNGESKPDWKDQPIYYPLNELGKDGWELVSFESSSEFSTYLLKKPGRVADNKKIDVWDQ
ncbi:MAG TPA: hypothetical protein PLQ56_20405 [Aggregatilineales bacterium]|nr:hypothetical protein [Anaerolineae bacterium]HUN08980.1 hypothetical protein [Aggregatilineales bacterium]